MLPRYFSDIDRDGDLDLVVGGKDGTLKYYLNESTQNNITFTEQTGNDNPFNGISVGLLSSPIFIDIDGDSDLDMIIGQSHGLLNYYLNESTTNSITFTPKTSTENPFNGLDVGYNSSPVFDDIDRDGDLDLVVGEYDGVLNRFLNNSKGGSIVFTNATKSNNFFNGIDLGYHSNPTFADIDGDGDLDLVGGAYQGTLDYFLNESTTNSITFTPKTSTENPFNGFDVGNVSTKPTLVDIDGDGDLDLTGGG